MDFLFRRGSYVCGVMYWGWLCDCVSISMLVCVFVMNLVGFSKESNLIIMFVEMVYNVLLEVDFVFFIINKYDCRVGR